jgi:hypothetical protein
VAVFKEMAVKKEAAKMVTFVCVVDQKPVKILARVKTDSDADALVTALESAKQQC